ncbi:M14 family metallocarboxypeptidase [Candidatus Peregrinibacteria bacterium]|nr:M14 family metallocarboxypeptidase [Candidatus Peregrinibacteria bacterium]
MFSETPKDYDAIPIRRSYDREVVRRLAKWHNATYANALEELGKAVYGSHTYALSMLYRPQLSRSRKKGPTVMLSAGVHGDEPAGVYALLDFLNSGMREYGDRCNFVVFPCVNPSGFEADTRRTMNGVDLNHSFGVGSAQPEVAAIEEWLSYHAHQFRLHIDLHEDNPTALVEDAAEGEEHPRACYLYEWMCDHRRRIGRQLINALPHEAAVCLLPMIEREENDCGVIAYPEALRNAKYVVGSLDAYTMKHRTDHTIVTETPAIWSMEKRIAVQCLWLRRALDLVLQ